MFPVRFVRARDLLYAQYYAGILIISKSAFGKRWNLRHTSGRRKESDWEDSCEVLPSPRRNLKGLLCFLVSELNAPHPGHAGLHCESYRLERDS
jgi:hypothetical protein